MLQSIRDSITGWMAYVVIAVLVVPFALWGIGDYLGVFGETYAVKVNDTEIPLAQYRNAYTQRYASLRDEMGAEFRAEAIDEAALRQAVLDELVDEELLYQYAEDRGMRISDAAMVEQIHEIPAFHDAGRFSTERYRYVLQINGVSPARFEHDLRRRMVLAQLEAAISGTAFLPSQRFEQLIRMGDQRREFAWLEIGLGQFADRISVDDEQVADYYEANRGRFMTDEMVDIEYIELTAAAVADSVTVDEDAIRARYEERRQAAAAQEERRASHILVESEETATMLRARLDDGEDFNALAAEHSVDRDTAADGGDLGWVGRGSFVREFENALYALEPGSVSGPVRTGFGWHLIRLDDVRGAAQLPSLEELRDELAAEYRETEADRRFYSLVERLADLAFENPDSLEPAAESLDISVRRVNDVRRREGRGIAEEPSVRNAVFSPEVLEQGFNSRLLELGPDHVVVVRVADRVPARQLELDEVEAMIRDQLMRIEAQRVANEVAEEILQRARAGEDLSALALEYDAEYNEPHAHGRSDAHSPPELTRAVFRAPRPEFGGEPVVGRQAVSNGVAIFRLYDVAPGAPEAMEADQVEGITRALASRLGGAEFAALLATLRAKASIDYGSNLFDDDTF